MKRLLSALVFVIAIQIFGAAQAATPAGPRLPKNRDLYFAEEDFIYRRFLRLARDGSYQQINRDGASAAEVDRGTWEQDADGTVLLHFTRDGLRFRSLRAGPLSITLRSAQIPADLAAASGGIRHWLSQTSDTVFAAASVREMSTASATLTISPQAESFLRANLESILRQLDDLTATRQRRAYRFSLHKSGSAPPLLIQEGGIFQAVDLPRVQMEYNVPRGRRPPFYFAQVNAETFAREAGSWQRLP